MKKRISILLAAMAMTLAVIAAPKAAFAMKPYNIANAYTSDIETQAYTGSPITPKPTNVRILSLWTDEEGIRYLYEGVDYTLRYEHNVDVGIGQCILMGIGDFAGSQKVLNFNIKEMRIDLAYATIEDIPAQQYTGNPITPKPSVSISAIRSNGLGYLTLYEGEDYTISYDRNVEKGMAQLTITAVPKVYATGREFVGSKTVRFKIDELRGELSHCYVASIPDQDYTGFAIEPKPEVHGDGYMWTDLIYEGKDYTLSYDHNINPGVATVTITGTGSKFIGSKTITFDIVPIQVYRVYNSRNGEHIVTADENEYRALRWTIGWQDEGLAWTAPVSSSMPVFRLYNPWTGEHHYTADLNEYNQLGDWGWEKEGLQFYSDPQQVRAVYRAFNPYAGGAAGSHHYTTDLNEYEALGKAGWRQEGTCWYAAPQT